jgi:hypothetical protein
LEWRTIDNTAVTSFGRLMRFGFTRWIDRLRAFSSLNEMGSPSSSGPME